MQAADSREPSWERMCTVVERDQTEWPATRQRDSVLRAEERRRESSRRRERWVEGSVDLGRERVQYRGGLGVGGFRMDGGRYRPGS